MNMSDSIKEVLYTEEQLQARVKELGAQITKDYAGKDKLLLALTGCEKEITPNAVEVNVSRLRGKLEPHGVALRTIRGFGYRLELQAS